MGKAKRKGLSGFIALAYGMDRMSAAELLSFANLCTFNGYPGVAAVALSEMAARMAAS